MNHFQKNMRGGVKERLFKAKKNGELPNPLDVDAHKKMRVEQRRNLRLQIEEELNGFKRQLVNIQGELSKKQKELADVQSSVPREYNLDRKETIDETMKFNKATTLAGRIQELRKKEEELGREIGKKELDLQSLN
ncbi:MAG: hypothetical protein HZA35_04160 [Parcubacteria group bacterium]|nr:hypothetical protein [Parcubacteria group bacterium]